jgi:hypothetical protein
MRRPDFFIVGAPRCGTTSMYELLREHPQVFMPTRKEPIYFGSDLTKRRPYLSEESYLALFAPAHDETRLGEASVWYLYSRTAPAEIAAFSPEARIIIMLRDPVQMMHSLHRHLLFAGQEEITDFGEAIEAEPDRAQGRRMPRDRGRPEGLQYRACARYAEHVERWIDAFGRERVHIILQDDLSADPAGTYRATLQFLDVDPTFQPEFRVINQHKLVRSRWLQRLTASRVLLPERASGLDPFVRMIRRGLIRINMHPEPRPPIPVELERRLRAEMAPDVERLERLLRRDLSAWTQAGSAT